VTNLKDKQDVVIMAELDWDGLYAQSHVMAKGFAAEGHRVFYINRTLQRWPRLRHLMTRLRPKAQLGVSMKHEIPGGITVVNLWVGPPVKWLRFINRYLIKSKLKSLDIRQPLFLTYVPTYNAVDVAMQTNAKTRAYVCYHNFDADQVVSDLLKSEREIITSWELLFADSRFLQKRLERISGERKVHAAPPGVHFDLFSKACRGDEVNNIRRIGFYGGAGPHLDIQTYNRLCDHYEVIFVAVINHDIKEQLDPRIKIIPPVANSQLPDIIRKWDVLTILYRRSDYIDGVIPAKFFECIATGKPVLVSGLQEAGYYSEYVYDTENKPEKALEIIRSLPSVHNHERMEAQFRLGKEADFSQRFRHIYQLMLQCKSEIRE
jgi:hypothetical protein